MTSASFLLDTDWVIHHFYKVERISARIELAKVQGIALSVVSLAELWDGVHHGKKPALAEQQLRQFLTSVDLLGITPEICERFGRLRGSLRSQGQPIPHFDILIACTALEYDLTLLSNNIKHFGAIQGLKLESL